MKTQIFYKIQKDDAIKAGKNQWGQFAVELDPTEVPEAARTELALWADDSKYSDLAEGLGLTEPITIERAIELLVQRAAERATKEVAQAARKAAEKADEERRHAERVEDLAIRIRERADWNDRDLNQMFYTDLNCYRGDLPADVTEILAKNAVAYAAHQEAERAKKEALEKIKADEVEHIAKIRADLLSVVLTEADLVRYEAGLMPADEQVQHRNDLLFAAFEFPKYEKISKSDIEHTDEYCEGQIDFETRTPVDGVTATEFDEFQKIKSVCGNKWFGEYAVRYKAEIEEHVGTCESCDGKKTRLAVRVEARVEELLIASRLFAL